MSRPALEKMEMAEDGLDVSAYDLRAGNPEHICEAMVGTRLNKKVRIVLDEMKGMALEGKDIEMSLSFGECYGRLLLNNPIGIYRDDSLEERLIPAVDRHVPHTHEEIKDRILHVISTPYNHGGHTRLLERLVGFFPQKSDVLVTRPYRIEEASLRLSKDITINSSQYGLELSEIVKIASSYKTICLHIDPDDLKSAVAVGVAKSRSASRVIFVNHADHAFSFGLYSADVVAEVSHFGLVLTRKHRSAESSFLGIPLNIEEYPQVKPKSKNVCEIFSAARPLKYKPSNNYSFPRVAMAILKEIKNARLTVLGARKRDYWWWQVKIRYPLRFKLIDQLPYVDYINSIKSADLYLDSLPMAGGTTLPEVRGQGVAVTGLVTGALGYTPFDKTKFTSCEELIDELRKYVCGNESRIEELNNSSLLIGEAKEMHSPSQVKQRFNGILAGEIQPCPVRNFHDVDIHFYEKQWFERGRMNTDWGLVQFLARQYMNGHRILLFKVIRAAGIPQLVHLFATNIWWKGKSMIKGFISGIRCGNKRESNL